MSFVVATTAALAVRRVEVTGESMLPALRPGDRLLLLRWGQVRTGAVVAAPDPRHPDRLVVKRVAAVDGGGVDLRGDAPERSTDSRHFGPVPRRSVVGRAVWRYSPGGRAGPIPGHG